MKMEQVFNKDAEAGVLSSILLDNKSLVNIVDMLDYDDFYITSHKIIYKGMLELYSKNENITPITLFENLNSFSGEIGGISYISELVASGTSSLLIESYANIVKEKSNNRKVIKELQGALKSLTNGEKKYFDVVDCLQSSFINLSNKEKIVEDMDIILQNYLMILEKRLKGEDQGLTLKTGLSNLDNFIGGFERHNLNILAGRPSMGKSLVSLTMALNMAIKSKLKVAFFHLEMGKLPTVERILSNSATIPMKTLKTGKLKDDQWSRIVGACDKISKANFHMFNDIYTLRSITAECKRIKFQKGLDVVFIDYLQLIEIGKLKENRNLDISFISRQLKLLAKELDITIVVLSQLSRAPESRSNHRPMLSDLRESGAIEQDADLVIFLYRDEYYNPDSEDKDLIEFIIGKHRNGTVGTVKMKWSGGYQSVGS